jgi:hypothetical protein
MTHEQIFEQLGITGASDEVKQSTLHNLVGAVEVQFASVSDELLTEEQDEELNKLVDAHDGDPTVVGDWLKAHIPEAGQLYQAILEDEIARLKSRLDA